MRKILFGLILIMFVPFLLFAEDMEKPMVIRTRIPEDYEKVSTCNVINNDYPFPPLCRGHGETYGHQDPYS